MTRRLPNLVEVKAKKKLGMNSKKIFIYSVPRNTATGISDFTNDSSGRRLKKNKIGRCRDGIQALYNPKVGGLSNYISYTPWIEDGKQVTDKDGKKLMLQHKLEQKWNLPEGYLTNRPRTSEDVRQGNPPTYYQKKRWTFNDGATILDLDNMDEELGYYVCLASKYVANSEKDLRAHVWPYAEYYIAVEHEADEFKYKKNERKSKAFAALHNANMTDAWKKKFVYILDIANARTTLTDQQAHNSLYDFIDGTTFVQGSNIDKFEELVNLLSTKPGREELEARLLLKKAVDNRILYEKQGSYTWIRPEGKLIIGDKYSEAIDFILNPKKQTFVEELEKQVKAKEL